MKQLKLLLLLIVIAIGLSGCEADTFAPERVITTSELTPSQLSYATLQPGREFSRLVSGVSTVNTGGVIPYFEIVGGHREDATPLTESELSYITISNATIDNVGTVNEPIFVDSYRTIGQITIADRNTFEYGKYSLSIKVTTTYQEQQYATTFDDVFSFTMLPALTSNLMYIPISQNLVTTNPNSATSTPYVIGGNPNRYFELASNTDILQIDSQTGVITIRPDAVITGDVELYPLINVVSSISGEKVQFGGNKDFLYILVSQDPHEMPLRKKIFFYAPMRQENIGINGGYTKFVPIIGSPNGGATVANCWKIATATSDINQSPLAINERPDELKNASDGSGGATLTNNIVGTPSLPHDSWIVFNPQNLTPFKIGFKPYATFWIYNQYVNYLSVSGYAPAQLEIYVSTDYSGNRDAATWTNVTAQVQSRIANGAAWLTDWFDGIPYPGNNNRVSINGSTANDQAANEGLKNTAHNGDTKWTKCVLDLTPYLDCENFTLAIRNKTNFTGTITVNGSYDRPGRFNISDVYYTAEELPQQ